MVERIRSQKISDSDSKKKTSWIKNTVRAGIYDTLFLKLILVTFQGWVANSTPGIFQWNLPEYSGLENMPKVANMANMENMILVL